MQREMERSIHREAELESMQTARTVKGNGEYNQRAEMRKGFVYIFPDLVIPQIYFPCLKKPRNYTILLIISAHFLQNSKRLELRRLMEPWSRVGQVGGRGGGEWACTCPGQWCVSPRCSSDPTPASSISCNLRRQEPA